MTKTKTIRSNKKRKRIYTKKHYMAGDGMMTSVWGPSMWHVLHAMSFNYPTNPSNKDKTHYRKFIESLQHVLPCKYCRVNLKKNLDKMPLSDKHLADRDTFSRYVYNLHEMVNTMLKKESGLTYCDVRERYENFRARCLTTKNKTRKDKKDKETGCTEPLWGKKAKCVLLIVPKSKRVKTFKMDRECVPKLTA